jgi:DNA helicase HerA-like ATPase
VLLRSLVSLETGGGNELFGEPQLDVADLLRVADDGRGVISCLELAAVQDKPKLFSTALMWLPAELFETLPEAGDLPAPKFVFFFDEAHLLFDDATEAFLDAVAQTVRLIRSKGVGVFFVTQTPKDVPGDVLGQLGNRVQHALRAFTPKDQKAVKAAAETFRANPKLKVADVIGELAVGEALVSTLDDSGSPTPVERALIVPPESRIGPATSAERETVIKGSALYGHYEKATDRESAY